MAKYCGNVGFVESVEVSPGIWEQKATEKKYKGDVLRNTRRWEPRDTLIDNLNLNNMISIVAKDEYARTHVFAIRYIWWMGSRWEVTNVEVKTPRLILTIGGVYNGPLPETGGGIPENPGE